ncbi:MAG: hypothetical protein ACOYJC_10310 [Christensenellales bacterium]
MREFISAIYVSEKDARLGAGIAIPRTITRQEARKPT